MNEKIKTIEEISKISAELKELGKIVVSINGSFDILHIGHIRILKEAKDQGDVLIVGLNTDESVRQWKRHQGNPDWSRRPINNEEFRAEFLSALECVDYIVLFSELTPIKLLESIKPNIHVNGSDYGQDCIEAETVKKFGGKIHIANWVDGLSTTNILKKIRNEE